MVLELLVLLGILVGSLLLQTLFRPHSDSNLSRLEVLGLLGCGLTIYSALYFFNTEGAHALAPVPE